MHEIKSCLVLGYGVGVVRRLCANCATFGQAMLHLQNFLRVKNTFFHVHRRRDRSRNSHTHTNIHTHERTRIHEDEHHRPKRRKFIAHHLCNFPHRRQRFRVTHFDVNNVSNWFNWKIAHKIRSLRLEVNGNSLLKFRIEKPVTSLLFIHNFLRSKL